MEKLILVLALLGVLFLLRSYIKLLFFLGIASFSTLVFLCSSPCTEALVWMSHQQDTTTAQVLSPLLVAPSTDFDSRPLLSFDNGKANLDLMEGIYEDLPHRFKRSRILKPLSGTLPF